MADVRLRQRGYGWLRGHSMVREPATRLAASGHRFVLRRMEHALVRRDVRMLDEPMRAQGRSLVVGVVLAVVVVAGCAVVALMRPQHALGDAPIMMVKESGALYVRLGDTLHPVLNLASARLVAGTPASPHVVRESELRKAKRGALLGIPGAPGVLPAPLPAAESQWTVCDDAAGTTVIAGPISRDIEALRTGRTLLVQARGDPGAATYLLYDGRRAHVNIDDVAVMRTLRLDGVEPTAVSSALLNAIPEAPPIAPPTIPDAGRPGPATLRGLPIGAVVRVTRADADEYYVVLAGGVQRVGRVAADLIRFADSQRGREIVSVAADVISATAPADVLPVAGFPDQVDAPVNESVVCAHWAPSWGDGNELMTVLAGQSIPLQVNQAPVALVQSDELGPRIDAVFVPPGRSLYVHATELYLIADTGVRFVVADSTAAAALGLSEPAVPAPWHLLKLLAEGPQLSRQRALVIYDGLAGTAPPN